MKKLVTAIFGALVSLAAYGQDLLECIDPDVTNALLMTAREAPEYSVSPDVPDRISSLEPPADFEWIGSRTTGYDTRAAYRTTLESKDAHQAFSAVLQQAGFTMREEDESGFLLRSPPLMTSFCNDAGTGVLIVRDIDDTRYVTLSMNTQLEMRTCAEMLNPTASSFIRLGFDLIPQIETPSEVRISTRPGAMPTGSGSGSGDTFTNSIEVEGVSSMNGLVATLADQIRAQGWVADATWSGRLSAGSAWTRELDDGTRLAGKLTVQSIGGDYHELSFSLLMMDQQQGFGGIRF